MNPVPNQLLPAPIQSLALERVETPTDERLARLGRPIMQAVNSAIRLTIFIAAASMPGGATVGFALSSTGRAEAG
jgi:hypothetical protein